MCENFFSISVKFIIKIFTFKNGGSSDATINNNLMFNECWSEVIKGGFFLKLSPSAGTTVLNNTMVQQTPVGNAQYGIINDGTKLLLTGSTSVNGVAVGVLTKNNGQTRVDGFASINNHTEETGGTYKNATYS